MPVQKRTTRTSFSANSGRNAWGRPTPPQPEDGDSDEDEVFRKNTIKLQPPFNTTAQDIFLAFKSSGYTPGTVHLKRKAGGDYWAHVSFETEEIKNEVLARSGFTLGDQAVQLLPLAEKTVSIKIYDVPDPAEDSEKAWYHSTIAAFSVFGRVKEFKRHSTRD